MTQIESQIYTDNCFRTDFLFDEEIPRRFEIKNSKGVEGGDRRVLRNSTGGNGVKRSDLFGYPDRREIEPRTKDDLREAG